MMKTPQYLSLTFLDVKLKILSISQYLSVFQKQAYHFDTYKRACQFRPLIGGIVCLAMSLQ